MRRNAKHPRLDVTRFLVESGANIEAKVNEEYYTPIT
jgi:hypothetical protein